MNHQEIITEYYEAMRKMLTWHCQHSEHLHRRFAAMQKRVADMYQKEVRQLEFKRAEAVNALNLRFANNHFIK